MTALVAPGKSRRICVHQLRVEDAPYTNCRICDLVRMLVWAGLAIPDTRRFIRVFREATGRPEIGKGGVSQGTTADDVLHAAAVLIPWVPLVFDDYDPDYLFEELEARRLTASVRVLYGEVGDHLSRWSPRFGGGHQIGAAYARRPSKRTRQVRWVDCLGLAPYHGEFVAWGAFEEILQRSGSLVHGRIWAMTLGRYAGMSTFLEPVEVYPGMATVAVPKGTENWELDVRSGRLESRKPIGALTAHANARYQPHQAPEGLTPTSYLVQLVDGPYAGRWVRTRAVTITPVPTDVSAAVAAATRPLKDRIHLLETTRDAGISTLSSTI